MNCLLPTDFDRHDDVIVGVIANPASGRDIRRLTAKASVFTAAEKANMVQRLLGPFGALGVDRVMIMPDSSGIAATVERSAQINRSRGESVWPLIEQVKMKSTGGVEDSQNAARIMRDAGARAIVVLGGDGTHRVIAKVVPELPMATLSTGTNNVFPDWREATVTGIATALHVTGRIDPSITLRRNKQLRVNLGEYTDIALVDVCVTRLTHVGARAVWDPDTIAELFVAFAEPDAIGLSSIAAMINPLTRDEPRGLCLRCGTEGRRVLAAIAPGVLETVVIDHCEIMQPGVRYAIRTERGSIALDGEREIEFHRGQVPRVTLELNGPPTLDVSSTLAAAARLGVMATPCAREMLR
ncbi:MAG: NAD(+)/NADH kinase [Chromatiaceae bacterium]|nr:NAD(+)/NADH kinase [Chromatiaceae bacterium]